MVAGGQTNLSYKQTIIFATPCIVSKYGSITVLTCMSRQFNR